MSKNLKTLLCCILSLVFVAGTIVAVFADSNDLFAVEAESVTNEDVTADVETTTAPVVEDTTAPVVEDTTAGDVEEDTTAPVVEDTTAGDVEENTTAGDVEEDSTADDSDVVDPEEPCTHDYVSVETTPATCTEDGLMTLTCSLCGDVQTEVIPATGHTPEWVVVKQATVKEAGLKQYICTVCQAVLDSEVIPAVEADKEDVTKEDVTVEDVTAEDTSDKVEDTSDVVDDEATSKDAEEDDVTTPDDDDKFMLGDVNFDGKITAEDARLALRIAAKLDDPSDLVKAAADVITDGKVEAKDARLILRVSAKLDDVSVFGAPADFEPASDLV